MGFVRCQLSVAGLDSKNEKRFPVSALRFLFTHGVQHSAFSSHCQLVLAACPQQAGKLMAER